MSRELQGGAPPLNLSALLPKGPITRVVAKFRVGEQPSEIEQWRDRSGNERLAALIEMRARYLRWKYGTEPRLERVLQVARRA
jgi:hypothetical protein